MDYGAAEEVYRNLGRHVVGAVGGEAAGGEWESARVVAEIEDGVSGTLYGLYRYAEGGAARAGQFDVGSDVYLLFERLRALTEHPDRGPWTRAVFKLTRELAFSVDFDYDPLDEDEGPWDRADRAEREMLEE